MNPYGPPPDTVDPIVGSSSFESHHTDPVYWVGRVFVVILVLAMLASFLSETG